MVLLMMPRSLLLILLLIGLALVRSFPLRQQQIVTSLSSKLVSEILNRVPASEAVIQKHAHILNKANFSLACMGQELTDEQWLVIKDGALADEIAELALRFAPAPPPDFLLSGLVLLLTGRRSVLLNPDCKAVESKPALKVSLRDDLRVDLRNAIEKLPTTDSGCAVDPAVVNRLKELLK